MQLAKEGLLKRIVALEAIMCTKKHMKWHGGWISVGVLKGIRGYHVDSVVREAAIGEELVWKREPHNIQNCYVEIFECLIFVVFGDSKNFLQQKNLPNYSISNLHSYTWTESVTKINTVYTKCFRKDSKV